MFKALFCRKIFFSLNLSLTQRFFSIDGAATMSFFRCILELIDLAISSGLVPSNHLILKQITHLNKAFVTAGVGLRE